MSFTNRTRRTSDAVFIKTHIRAHGKQAQTLRGSAANISSILKAFQDYKEADLYNKDTISTPPAPATLRLMLTHTRRKVLELDALTLVATVFKLWVVVVLIQNQDGDLADPDERLLGLIGGSHGQSELPLALSVKTHRRCDHTW